MTNAYVPGLENVVAAQTNISYLDVEQEEIVIRGYDLIELAQKKKYTDVIQLLLFGRLPSDHKEQSTFISEKLAFDELPHYINEILWKLPVKTHPMDALRTSISALAGTDVDLNDESHEANLCRALRLLNYLPQIVANSYRILQRLPLITPQANLSYSARFLHMITGKIPTPIEEHIFDQTLILYSEHEMPNSTFTARVIASSMADLYGALTGATASLKGRLHGGANEAVMELLVKVQTIEQMEDVLMKKLNVRERIMGFGHRVYMRKPDPRAVLLKEALQIFPDQDTPNSLSAICRHGEAVMRREKNLYPNLDYYAAPLYHLLGIPTPLFTPIFLASRTLGICTHVIEQHENNRLYRPRVHYIGLRGLHP